MLYTQWMLAYACFTFLLCMIALCMMYVCMYTYIYIYIYAPAHVWVIVHFVWRTLMVMLVTVVDHEHSWPCSVDMFSRNFLQVHIHAILCAWSSRCNCPDPCHLSDISFPMYATRINMVDALKGFGLSRYEHNTRHIHRFETLLVHHSAPNAKLCQIFTMKMGHFHCRILIVVRIVFYVPWRTWGEAPPNFHHGNKAKCCWIFVMEIKPQILNALWKHQLGPHPF